MLKMPVPLSTSQHGKLKLKPLSDFSFAAETACITISASEVPQVLHDVVLAFSPVEGGGFSLVGLYGLQPKLNLMVAPTGRWLGGYVPAALRRYPFVLGRPKDSSDLVLCIDEGSGLLSETDGEPLFDADGGLGEPVKRARDLLHAVHREEEVLRQAIRNLQAANLIIPWTIELKAADGSPRKLGGLYRIDEAALSKLGDEEFCKLRPYSALTLAYAQLMSMNVVSRLQQLENLRSHLPKPPEPLQVFESPPSEGFVFDFGS